MATSARSVYQRIRSVKSSLENAEQSFLDNNGMRGELDLMLAEAELKNLRRKKDVPWSWNRQLLAICSAAMLALAGLGGWYYAQGSAGYIEAAPVQAEAMAKTQTKAAAVQAPAPQIVKQENSFAAPAKQPAGETVIDKSLYQNVAAQQSARQENQITISKDDMRRLVQSARVELSNSK